MQELPDPRTSPWHAGEKRLQEQAGVAERMEVFGQKVIRDYMPDQHRDFYRQLPFLVTGAVDAHGKPWATLLEGPEGFVSSPDPQQLLIDAALVSDDPATPGLVAGGAIGLLGIELHSRRRNRIMGLSGRRPAASWRWQWSMPSATARSISSSAPTPVSMNRRKGGWTR